MCKNRGYSLSLQNWRVVSSPPPRSPLRKSFTLALCEREDRFTLCTSFAFRSLLRPKDLFATSSRDVARASILPSSSPRFNALVMPLATSRKSRPIAVVFCSGGSQAVDRWEVDNAFNTLHGGQPAAAASTILAILNCSLFAAPRTAAALVYCMLPRPPLCMVLFDYVSQWNLLLGLDLDLPVSYYRYSNRSSSDC